MFIYRNDKIIYILYKTIMACKGCKDKKPEIEQHVSIVNDNGVRKYSFPKWGLIIEGKTMLEALEKAREIMKKKSEGSDEE